MSLSKTQKKKKAQGKCVAHMCRTKAAPNNNYCHKHIKRRFAQNNPEKYKWMVLRNNALRRGKEFTLTYEEFLDFLKQNPSYMEGSGTSVDSLHIDRIDASKGYSKDNIQCLTLLENVNKQHNVDYENGELVITETDEELDLPF